MWCRTDCPQHPGSNQPWAACHPGNSGNCQQSKSCRAPSQSRCPRLCRRCELEHRAHSSINTSVSAAVRCGAVQIARSVLDQTSRGVLSIRAVRTTDRTKAVEHRFLTRAVHLEHRAAVVMRAASRGGAVQIARSVLDQTSRGGLSICAVRSRAKAVEHRLVTRAVHLEYRAAAVRTT